MSNIEPKPSVCELTEEELEKATGGITVTKRFDVASPKLFESIPTEPC